LRKTGGALNKKGFMKNSVRILYLFLGMFICISLSAQKPSTQCDKLNEYKISNRDFEKILANAVNNESVRNASFLYLSFGKEEYKNKVYESFQINAGDDWNEVQKVNGIWGYLLYRNKIFVLSGSLIDKILVKTKKKKRFYYTIKPFDFRYLTTCGGVLVHYFYIDGHFVAAKEVYSY
jgi:hypothetical protein